MVAHSSKQKNTCSTLLDLKTENTSVHNFEKDYKKIVAATYLP